MLLQPRGGVVQGRAISPRGLSLPTLMGGEERGGGAPLPSDRDHHDQERAGNERERTRGNERERTKEREATSEPVRQTATERGR